MNFSSTLRPLFSPISSLCLVLIPLLFVSSSVSVIAQGTTILSPTPQETMTTTYTVSSPAPPGEPVIDEKTTDAELENILKTFYQKAETAVLNNDRVESDYWMARYIGLTSAFHTRTKRNPIDLTPLYKKRVDLCHPARFISPLYCKGFLDFYFFGTNQLWFANQTRINKDRMVAISANKDSNSPYYARLFAYPSLSTWALINLKGEVTDYVVPMGSRTPAPYLSTGKINEKGELVDFPPLPLDVSGGDIHFVWPIEFHDLGGAHMVWVRYNIGKADGFVQCLQIFKIVDHQQPILVKTFIGDYAGIARRLPDGTVQVGSGDTDKKAGLLLYEITRLQTWEYKNGEFVKKDEVKVPNILWSDGWKHYYFDNLGN